MWKKAMCFFSQKKQEAEKVEESVTEQSKIFKACAVKTWSYHMTDLPLNEGNEREISQFVSSSKEERIVGESV